jgi:hypothetical protein
VLSDINNESIAVVCKLIGDTIHVNPNARPACMSLIETLLDHHIP